MNRSKAGFSLVEVLAALVVTTMLVLALTPFVGQMLATWSRGSEVTRVVELTSRGVGTLREDLRNAIVWTGYGTSEARLGFRGTESTLMFPAATGLAAGQNGVEMLSFSVDSSSDGRALVRRRAPIVGSTYTTFQDPVVLFSGQFRFVFRYVARTGKPQSTWANRIELPSRVELNIVGDRGPIFSAPIELPTMASLSAACLVATNLPGCPAQPPEDENAWMKEYGLTPDQP